MPDFFWKIKYLSPIYLLYKLFCFPYFVTLDGIIQDK